MTQRYAIGMTDRQAFEMAVLGLQKAFQLLEDDKEQRLVLIVPLYNFSDTWLGKAIDAVKALGFSAELLEKNRVIKIDKVNIELLSSAHIDRAKISDVLVAYLSTDKDLVKIDNLVAVKNVVFIPHLQEELDGWIEKWNPEIL
ncbi:hypothetical protein P7L54_20835 [Acinetobacter bereziniae]|uniref:Uncharacterized protein n=1 Tax=Acinetobacter bereziniae LMG 1003 = CIP 70.12 TaxID=981324 RepID=N9DKE8_ACIBZ|nr:hypothetical protein [Acinetobacter bereziniae]ENV98301.1 hypothetical protein F938_01155 [Acinetobacter bereziniae LMG 1003 = CIP 70.12]MBJ9908550.1 hypothetical protein [Acinetobacter bereziniae]MBJ9929859.1 hypothetical protein [Acinetobacter bereziniae]MDG3558388.1 hypothetical protein [Acinetobacter bereziniae]MDP6003545.1 hypothetical protein [Acinetobacter bereziniae]